PQSKHFGKIFSIGGTILFDMYEDEKSLGTFRAVVRNIKPLEKLFRIGCQFFHISDEHKIIDDLMQKFFPQSLESQSQEADNAPKTEKPATDPKLPAVNQPVATETTEESASTETN
ncbi:MAG TPA: PilZ domain-containing protein, partial [Leptospiraceae bacterium]|nr:PilZ domain-containing protein [Leptospiraceae bacterium]